MTDVAADNTAPDAANPDPSVLQQQDEEQNALAGESLGNTGEYKALQEQYLRLAADFDNFRKRSQAEKDTARRYGTEAVLQQLLPVLDNLDRASASLNEQSDAKFLYQSFRMIYNQLLEGLTGVGLKKLSVVGQPFDPALHEAVTQTETEDHPENTVVQELQSGFSLAHQGEDTVLRPAMVSVSCLPSPKPAGGNPFSAASSADAKIATPQVATPQTATGV